jgi:glycosyltransferase involved in cell wall biosynthesis
VPVFELVFFGRLETRKGVVTFCDAVDAILGIPKNVKNGSMLSPSGKEELSKAPTSNERKQEGAMKGSSPAPSKDGETSGFSSAEAVAHFSDVRSGLQRVTFLGRSAIVEREWGVEYVQRRATAWGGFPWKIVTRMDPPEAKEYLRGEGRLAVIPSKVENSPYTVYEVSLLDSQRFPSNFLS